AARVKAVFYPVAGRLVAAFVTDFYAGTAESGDSAAYRYVIAADDGRVLERRDLTVSEAGPNPPSAPPPTAFTYRVYADPATLRPPDGPQIRLNPHPTRKPAGTAAPFRPANPRPGGRSKPPPPR